MLEKIISFIINLVGTATISIIIFFIIINTLEKIEIKIKNDRDPKTNIKHINRLIRKIEKQGWRVEAHDTFVYGDNDKPMKTYKAIDEVRLSKSRRTKLGIEIDEENKVVN